MGIITRTLRSLLELPARIDRLRDEVEQLRDQVDAFKSVSEVPAALENEYRQWKANTSLPNDPLVSVCIATFNRANLLTERAIPSILAQTYPRLEVIVVGDHCTDETEDLIRDIQDPRLRFVNLPERGSYPADPKLRWMVAGTTPTNHALRMATGDLITHLDDDDQHAADRLEKLVDFMRATDADLVWHPFTQESPSGEWVTNQAEDFRRGSVTTSSVLYRSWFKRIEWNPNAYRLREPGDWNRFRRIQHLGARTERYPEPLLRHFKERNQEAK